VNKALNAEFEAAVSRLRELTEEAERLIDTDQVISPAHIEMTVRTRYILDTFFPQEP
jgi:hypothetical protein